MMVGNWFKVPFARDGSTRLMAGAERRWGGEGMRGWIEVRGRCEGRRFGIVRACVTWTCPDMQVSPVRTLAEVAANLKLRRTSALRA